eukprot:GEMP01046226.1.p1 GENE.GEMP01046226.1~~GEMP01046226.1.p1  ORF type:complete len:227 (+),score=58.92 GEMP01046226.1:38-718(+)
MGAGKGITSLPTVVNHPGVHQYMLDHSIAGMTDVQKRHWEVAQNHADGLMTGSADEAKFLSLVCQMIGAKKVIEVGTFLGTTTLAIAQNLPEGGKVHTLDLSSEYLDVAKPFWEEAKVSGKIDVHLGPAVDSMKALEETDAGTFDLVFIDADKVNYDTYYELALILLRVGGIIAIDNVLWFGKVLLPDKDEQTKAIDTLNKKVALDDRVFMSMLEVADGLTLCLKK